MVETGNLGHLVSCKCRVFPVPFHMWLLVPGMPFPTTSAYQPLFILQDSDLPQGLGGSLVPEAGSGPLCPNSSVYFSYHRLVV